MGPAKKFFPPPPWMTCHVHAGGTVLMCDLSR